MACLSLAIFIPLSDFLLCDQMGLGSKFDTTLGFTVTNNTAGDAFLKTPTTVAHVYLASGATSLPQTALGKYSVRVSKPTGTDIPDVYFHIQATAEIFEVLPGNAKLATGQYFDLTSNFV